MDTPETRADLDIPMEDDAGAIGSASTVRPLAVPRKIGPIRAIVTTARPRQWAKNVLVFGAPATAGVLLEPDPLRAAVAAFVAFCLVASGVYFLNDVVDVASDLQHPTKRLRPVAATRFAERRGASQNGRA